MGKGIMACSWIGTHTHTYTHTRIHTYIHTHTHTHTHVQGVVLENWAAAKHRDNYTQENKYHMANQNLIWFILNKSWIRRQLPADM